MGSSSNKEALLGGAKPMKKNEIDELYTNESSMCKIQYEENKEGIKKKISGTGFFCKIKDENIPFKKALFTNNHIINEKNLEIGKVIILENLNTIKKIEITEKRRDFTDINLDYTCIEIFDTDKINEFFKIDKTIFDNKSSLLNKEIFILQYALGEELSHSSGKILNITDEKITHNAPTENGSSGSPLIKRYNIKFVYGIHFEGKEYNYAIPFDAIIKNIKDKLYEKNENQIKKVNEYKTKIKIIYEPKEKSVSNIFGQAFVNNNFDNIELIINGIKSNLIEKYELKEGINNIEIIIKNKITNLEKMFYKCEALTNIQELKYLNMKEVKNFSYMFCGCSSLSDLKPLQNWNVSNGNNFSDMFRRCSSLSDDSKVILNKFK